MDASDYLFQEGDLRTHACRVEQGAIAVYEKRLGRPNQVIEIVGRGDFVGLGCFERYRDNALAMESTLLTCLDEQEFIALAERDPSLRKQQADAIHRYFERHKADILNGYPSTPVEALAAFLASVSRQNVHEGRNATIVTDSLKCGAVANLLGFDIETLGKALLDLENKGLIQEGSNGQLHLLDLERLEWLADGAVTLREQRPCYL
ncbi:MAG: Crp/Fnr family transcriptional regulator [Hyphomicrobiaceae bacterium]|nr:Crp/Fnr family transcriptional regulator [Hyphomicrobiaceae bacterium]